MTSLVNRYSSHNTYAGLIFTFLSIGLLLVGQRAAATEFDDVPDDHPFAEEIHRLAQEGITRGCNPPANDHFCPDDSVTRGQMAAFLVRAFGFLHTDEIDFRDDNGSEFESDIERLAAAGVTKGCNPPDNDRFCPDAPVTRGQMAAFLTRAFGLPIAVATDFVDDNESEFEADIARLGSAGVTRGCNPPDNDRFCPDAPVTRGQMAAFLSRTPVMIPAGSDIQAYIDGHPEGTKFFLKSGRYVAQSLRPEDRNWFLGQPGAVLDGLDQTPFAFRSHASHIVIANLEITGYGDELQDAPIQAKTHERQEGGIGWVVENNDIHHNTYAGLQISDRGVARNNRVHHNGQIGLKVAWAPNGALVEGNQIDHNNYLGFGDGFEDGGTKFGHTDGLIVRDNWVHDNYGPGLWTDTDNRDTLYANNLVEGNRRNGIYHEISYSAVIRNNHVFNNGHGHRSWLWGGGIVIAGSSNVEIYGNTLGSNGNGISLIEQDRGSGRYGQHLLRSISVHDNQVCMSEGRTGVVMDNGDEAVLTPGNAVFRDNEYLVPDASGEWWRLGDANLDFADWQANGRDQDGSLRTTASCPTS